MIRITYQISNGERCHCHRQVYDRTIDCYSMQEATREATKIEFMRKEKDEDIRITNIAIVRDIDESKWPIDQNYYENLKAEYLDNKQKEAKRIRDEELEYKRQQLEELKKELEKS